MSAKRTVTIAYRNWRGQVEARDIVPRKLVFSVSAFKTFPAPEWLLHAYCKSRKAERVFSVKDILHWSTAK